MGHTHKQIDVLLGKHIHNRYTHCIQISKLGEKLRCIVLLKFSPAIPREENCGQRRAP